MARAWRWASAIGTGLAIAGTVHSIVNVRRLPRPPQPSAPVPERVSVLIPARNEAHRIAPTLQDVLTQEGVPNLEIRVLDDGSIDDTATVVGSLAASDPRLTLLIGGDEPLPAGWLGKPWACQRLAAEASGSVLVFLDADVRLAPHAIAAAVTQLRAEHRDFASPWPRQIPGGPLGRLIQPLQQWSWLTTLPLTLARSPHFASMAAANGQFLVISTNAYRSVGGHSLVADRVLEDIEFARAMKRHRRRITVWDGSDLASCRMYDDDSELIAGYRKSLWAAFGSPDNAPIVRATTTGVALLLLTLAYVAPPVAATIGPDRSTRAIGLIGYLAGAFGRATTAAATGTRAWPDALLHPVSITALSGLTVDSMVAQARGKTTWKGRSVAPALP